MASCVFVNNFHCFAEQMEKLSYRVLTSSEIKIWLPRGYCLHLEGDSIPKLLCRFSAVFR